MARITHAENGTQIELDDDIAKVMDLAGWEAADHDPDRQPRGRSRSTRKAADD